MNTNLTVLENFSFVAEVARSVAQLNEAKYAILAVPSSRILGVVALPLAGVADAFAHLFLATGKIATGVIISPYNTFAVTFFPNIAAPVDLEFSSALVHLARIVQGLIDGILLPFICLLNPARVHKMTSHRLPQEASSENETAPETLERQREREEQEREIEDLANRLRQLEAMEPPRDPSVPLPPSNNPPLPPSGNPPPPPPHPSTTPSGSGNPPPPPPHPSTTPLGSGNPPPPPSGNPPPPPPPHPSTTSSGSGNPPPPDSGARANLLEHIRRGTSLRTPRVLVNSGAGTVPVPVQLVHCHEELFNDPVKFGLFSRSKADFEDFMEDLEWLGGSNNYDGEERRINSVLNNSFVKETGMVKGKVTLVEDDVKALVAYFKLFKKKADDKSNEIIEKRRQEEQEALQRAAQQPTPVVEPKETPLAKRQKELLASLVIKNGHDLQAAIDLLNTKLVKKGRLQQNFRDANEKLHQKDRFKDLDAFIAKYNEIITAINSAQDLSDLSAERIKNIQIIIDAIKKDLED